MMRIAPLVVTVGLCAMLAPCGAMAIDALFVPGLGADARAASHGRERAGLAHVPSFETKGDEAGVGETGAGMSALDLGEALGEGNWNQVRIEQHLIIRITPRMAGPDPNAPPPPPPEPVRLRERKTASCMPVGAIAGVRPLGEGRIMLMMRDRRLIAADLARNCSGRDFYMGFYLTSNNDGQLCVERDTIHSRAGTSCTITRMRELVPEN
ncbi:hypothetical protein Y88_1244 [Novosphingobium nitrogenifigens DSM 19370]|uniref:Uncharacterized protein n=1 Tax=Novosphingobium nitrogenifigens DSM 19370 TaxID=983920 RepID=F1Z843_9SPHN|nr:hypothetical protein [Novosphingobium nitrogenifigens]EGD59182.1 hypothetical protein Y88_1244 [Novosphingobium nitrogenifigens DSM 19370]